ncbi:Threonine/homoserine/homoserine lactone efflux protein [Pseudarcicella hirudinis]|uniref:Threonine/homoserine/homoserine lactone efflux protein n=1 Tax=Pseudarcicella hirudinis TaxID=1079859 RepID=A0A1I5QZB8_9BACT|nr:LysE family transporter [Pseudarcicella hirudinis]SFP51470.1 Threonine/homoserine/homoserine lactone efflux protein [Pseudarcicella hirudinis]
MKFIIIYFVTAFISYLATIQPGPLSLFVTRTTLKKGITEAMWVAWGGVLCETLYAYLATEGLQLFDHYPKIVQWMQWIIIIILLTVGIFTIFQKNSVSVSFEKTINGKILSFVKGISLSLFNPQLLAFWLVILLGYEDYSELKINTFSEKIIFSIGAGSGTFGLVYTYSYLANRKRELVFKYLGDTRLNLLIGCTFIGLAILQLSRIILNYKS